VKKASKIRVWMFRPIPSPESEIDRCTELPFCGFYSLLFISTAVELAVLIFLIFHGRMLIAGDCQGETSDAN
jgi:hypothetical protein